MNREQALNLIYRNTHPDFRGTNDRGEREILMYMQHGGAVVRLDDLTDEQILDRLPPHRRATYQPTKDTTDA